MDALLASLQPPHQFASVPGRPTRNANQRQPPKTTNASSGQAAQAPPPEIEVDVDEVPELHEDIKLPSGARLTASLDGARATPSIWAKIRHDVQSAISKGILMPWEPTFRHIFSDPRDITHLQSLFPRFPGASEFFAQSFRDHEKFMLSGDACDLPVAPARMTKTMRNEWMFVHHAAEHL